MTKQILELINAAAHVCIVSHKSPDADTIGSALGLYHALVLHGKKCSLACVDTPPPNLMFLNSADKFKRAINKEADLVICCDVSSRGKLALDLAGKKSVCIDHHASNDGFADLSIVRADYSSTAEAVYEFLCEAGLAINKPAALALYTALASDSRFFSTPRVNERSFKMAQDLCKIGVDTALVTRQLKYSFSLSAMRLFGKVLRDFELLKDASVILACIKKGDYEDYEDTSEIADFLLGYARARVAVLLIEVGAGVKGSFRSKAQDVLGLAAQFGGGGHKNAAGFFLAEPLDLVRSKVLKALDV